MTKTSKNPAVEQPGRELSRRTGGEEVSDPHVNRRRNGTPYRLPKGTPASSCIGSARVGPGLSI